MTKSAVEAGSENSHPEYTNNGVENATIKLHTIAERCDPEILKNSRNDAATANAA